MKDQYVGDISDFAKFRLLRAISPCFHRLVVGWMLTEPDGKGDGRFLSYLDDPSNGVDDADLFEVLTELVAADERSVAALEDSGVLSGSIFHSGLLPYEESGRAVYFSEIAASAGPDSLIFLDPDNGLEVSSIKKGRPGAERYVYWTEVSELCESGASILIYQHFPRVQRVAYVQGLLQKLGSEIGGDYETFCAHTSRVAFLFGVRTTHRVVREIVQDLCASSKDLSFVG